METKITVKSGRFKELNIEVYETKNEVGKTINIIRHSTLIDIVNNRLPDDIHVEYDWDDIQVLEPHHYIVKAQVKDSNGVCVREFGESLPATLKTDIAKQYPAIIATNRAIDRAIIKYLNLPRTYSSEEISLNNDALTDKASGKNTTETSKEKNIEGNVPIMKNIDSLSEIEVEPKEEPKTLSLAEKKKGNLKPNMRTSIPAQEQKEEPVPADEENDIQKTEEPIENVDAVINTNDKDEAEASTTPHKTVGNTVKITFGRCNGMTLDEAYEKDLTTLKWIAENIYSGTHVKLGNTVRKYLDFKNVTYKKAQAS